ncbi:MAG: hypothetical protein ABJP48_00015 [Erythrobacter sp.]
MLGFLRKFGAVRDYVRAGDALSMGQNSLALELMEKTQKKLGKSYAKPSLVDIPIRHAFAATRSGNFDRAREALLVAEHSLGMAKKIPPDDMAYLYKFCQTLAFESDNLDILKRDESRPFDHSKVSAERKRNFPLVDKSS